MTGFDAVTLVVNIDRLAQGHVVCVGDVMLDRFVYGDVNRVSPEAPIPVCRVSNETVMLGGAGNVVRNLVAVGAKVDFVSVVGEDDIGAEVELLLRDLDGVDHTLVGDATRPTTSKVRYLADGQQLLRADREVTAPITGDIEDALFAATEKHLADAGALIVSDYGKGVITDRLIELLIGAAVAAGKPVIVDQVAGYYALCGRFPDNAQSERTFGGGGKPAD